MNTSMAANVRSFANTVEKGFDIAGYIPVISKISGPLRMLIGKTMVVAGLVLTLGSSFVQEVARRLNTEASASFQANYGEVLKDVHELGRVLTLNGTANVARGFVESLGLLGNLLMLGYDCGMDYISGRKFLDYSSDSAEGMRPTFNRTLVQQGLNFVRDTVDSFKGRAKPGSQQMPSLSAQAPAGATAAAAGSASQAGYGIRATGGYDSEGRGW